MTEFFQGERYEIVAWARDQKVLYYRESGGATGDWYLISEDTDNYYIYEDVYGSPGCCDAFDGVFGNGEYGNKWSSRQDITREEALEFAIKYQPFIVIPKSVFNQFRKEEELKSLLPRKCTTLYLDALCHEVWHRLRKAVKQSKEEGQDA